MTAAPSLSAAVGTPPTNRRSSDSKCRVKVGVDTVEIGFRDQISSGVISALAKLDTWPTPRGFVLAFPDVCGARVSAYESGLVKVSARLGALCSGDADHHKLVPQAGLEQARESAEAVIVRACGLAPPASDLADVRRLDFAAERHFDASDDGLAFLRAAALMTPGALYKSKLIRGADGQVQTGYVITGKGRVIARVYDKGVESGTAPAGHRIRLEAQARYRATNAQSPSALARTDLRPVASRAWASYAQAPKEVVVAGPDAAAEELIRRAATGKLTVRKAERMIGTLTILREHGRSFYDERQGQRRLADLRAEGVLLDDTLDPSRVVPVGSVLREFLASVEDQRPA